MSTKRLPKADSSMVAVAKGKIKIKKKKICQRIFVLVGTPEMSVATHRIRSNMQDKGKGKLI